jgi:hypothetical protein
MSWARGLRSVAVGIEGRHRFGLSWISRRSSEFEIGARVGRISCAPVSHRRAPWPEFAGLSSVVGQSHRGRWLGYRWPRSNRAYWFGQSEPVPFGSDRMDRMNPGKDMICTVDSTSCGSRRVTIHLLPRSNLSQPLLIPRPRLTYTPSAMPSCKRNPVDPYNKPVVLCVVPCVLGVLLRSPWVFQEMWRSLDY